MNVMGKLVVAIDPGKTTGVAIRTPDGKFHTCVLTSDLEVWELVQSHNWDTVVFETFATSNLVSAYGIKTIELVGAIRAICALRGLEAIAQAPVRRVPYVKKARKLITYPHQEHEVDALAHLLRWEADDASQVPDTTT
jgi:hypothetical protein